MSTILEKYIKTDILTTLGYAHEALAHDNVKAKFMLNRIRGNETRNSGNSERICCTCSESLPWPG